MENLTPFSFKINMISIEIKFNNISGIHEASFCNVTILVVVYPSTPLLFIKWLKLRFKDMKRVKGKQNRDLITTHTHEKKANENE